jgi:succinate-acetate transporter protein
MSEGTATADPAPLGLSAFGLTTLLLSLSLSGVFGIDLEMAVVPLAVAFGGTIQLIAGVLEYLEGNTFGTVAFLSYGAFWWWFGLFLLLQLNGWIPEVSTAAFGMVLVGWGIFTTYMWIATFKLNWALWVVFGLAVVTFFTLGIADIMGNSGLAEIGGWIGILLGLSALYTAAAEVINWSFGDTVVPLGGVPLGE